MTDEVVEVAQGVKTIDSRNPNFEDRVSERLASGEGRFDIVGERSVLREGGGQEEAASSGSLFLCREGEGGSRWARFALFCVRVGSAPFYASFFSFLSPKPIQQNNTKNKFLLFILFN